MIEQLHIIKEKMISRYPNNKEIMDKVNEIIDVVNEHIGKENDMRPTPLMQPFVEQKCAEVAQEVKPWRAKKGEHYFFVGNVDIIPVECTCNNTEFDERRFDTCNMFKTFELAADACEKISKILEQSPKS